MIRRMDGTGGPADAGAPSDPRQELAEMARAMRAFAQSRPAGFAPLFAPRAVPAGPDAGTSSEAAAPMLRVVAALAGQEHALEAERTVTAWAYGFISMELAGAFNLGGDVDRAYEFGISCLADVLAERRAS